MSELRPCLVSDEKYAIGLFIDGEFIDWQEGPMGNGTLQEAKDRIAELEFVCPFCGKKGGCKHTN